MTKPLLTIEPQLPASGRRGNGDRRRQEPARHNAQTDTRFGCLERLGLAILDQHGHVTHWNSGAEALTGFTTIETVGLHISRVYPPQDIAAGAPAFDLKQARCKKTTRCDGWRMQKGGATRWLSVEISRLLDSASSILASAY